MCVLAVAGILVVVGVLVMVVYSWRSVYREPKIELVVVMEVLLLKILPKIELVAVVQSRPDEPANIPSFLAVEVLHAPQSSCSKDDAPENISSMLVTLDTSHLERSPLNDDA